MMTELQAAVLVICITNRRRPWDLELANLAARLTLPPRFLHDGLGLDCGACLPLLAG
jgi:hypothetical protein